MCQFFKKRSYPDSAVTTGKYRAQEIDRQIALQTSQTEETNRIPFTLTYHSLNLAVKNAILKNFKILRNDPKTKHLFPLPPLISFKRDNSSLGAHLSLTTNQEPSNVNAHDAKLVPLFLTWFKMSGPNRSPKITDHFTCISANVIYCITCSLYKKIYIGETGGRLADRFREHLQDIEKTQMRQKPVRAILIFLITPTT